MSIRWIVGSCIEVFRLLICNGSEVENLGIVFPPLADFSSSLFEENLEVNEVMHSCKINQLRIQLRCHVECENGKLMVSLFK